MSWEKEKQTIKINNTGNNSYGGSAISRHQHGNSTISGAYYVRAPEKSGI